MAGARHLSPFPTLPNGPKLPLDLQLGGADDAKSHSPEIISRGPAAQLGEPVAGSAETKVVALG